MQFFKNISFSAREWAEWKNLQLGLNKWKAFSNADIVQRHQAAIMKGAHGKLL